MKIGSIHAEGKKKHCSNSRNLLICWCDRKGRGEEKSEKKLFNDFRSIFFFPFQVGIEMLKMIPTNLLKELLSSGSVWNSPFLGRKKKIYFWIQEIFITFS